MEPLRSEDPSRIAGYRLKARLGVGGMGRVYLARSPGGRPVAFKVIRADLADDPGFRERFSREVAAARAVSGAFTAPVLAADPDGHPAWLATGYVAGVPLNEAVRDFGPLPMALDALAGGLAEALVAVHAAGLVHRDLKPSNVMLAADGPRVIDFGIARALGESTLTLSGGVIGSPGFLAPEQVGVGEVGPATDVFAYGLVLLYAATGRIAFEADTPVALLLRIIQAEPDLTDLPAAYAGLVTACLAKDPADRPTPQQILERLPGSTHGGDWLPERLSARIVERSAALFRADPVDRPPKTEPEPESEPAPPVERPTVASVSAAATEALRQRTGAEPTVLRSPAAPPQPVDSPPAANRKRRWIPLAAAAAAVAVMLAVVLPGVFDDDSPNDKASSAEGPRSGGGASGDPAVCQSGTVDLTAGSAPSGFTEVNPGTGVFNYDNSGKVIITSPAGTDIRPDLPDGATAPILYGMQAGDFTVEAQVTVDGKVNYQGAGLVMFNDANNFVRLERGFSDTGDAVGFGGVANGEATPITGADTALDTVSLQLVRKGPVVTASWRPTDADPWQPVQGLQQILDGPVHLGVAVVNATDDSAAPPLSAVFSGLKTTCSG